MANPSLAALLRAVERLIEAEDGSQAKQDAIDELYRIGTKDIWRAAHQHAEALRDYLFHPDDDEIVRAAADFLDSSDA